MSTVDCLKRCVECLALRMLSLYEAHPETDVLGVMGRATDGIAPLLSGNAL